MTILIAVVSVFSSILFNHALLSKSSYAANETINYVFAAAYGNRFDDNEITKTVSVSSSTTGVVPELSTSKNLAYGYYFSHWELGSVIGTNNEDLTDSSSAAEELFEGQSLPTILSVGNENVSATVTYNAVFLKYTYERNDDEGSITYTSSDNEKVKITFTGSITDSLDKTRQDVLDFYQGTLGWSIDANETSTTTWYLPRTTGYNNGLPTLRAFLKFKTISLNIRVVDYNGETILLEKNNVASRSIPEDYSLTTNDVSGSSGYSFYGYTFSALGSGEVEFENDKVEVRNNSITIVFKEVKKNIAPKFVMVPLEFSQPTVTDTAKTSTYGPNWEVDVTGVATKKNGGYIFKVHKNTQVKYSKTTENSVNAHKFTFSALKKSIEEGKTSYKNESVTVTLENSEGCDLDKIGYTSKNETESEYFYKKDTVNKEALTISNGDEAITATYSVTKYNMSFGYTVKGEKNNNGELVGSENTNGNKSGFYYPNGTTPDESNTSINVDAYQDVLVQLGQNLSVAGFELPTKDDISTLKGWFGADWSKLNTENSSFTCWLLDVTAITELGYEEDENGRWYKGSSWVAFDYYDKSITLNNRKSLYIQVSKIYGVGDFTFLISDNPKKWDNSEHGYEGSYVMPLIPNWSRNYNVAIQNTMLSGKSSDVYYSGVVRKGENGTINVTEKADFTINSKDTSTFVYSNETAFHKSDEIANKTLFNTDKNYGVFRYGYDISAYTITFNYGGTPYYAKFDGESWSAITSETPVSIDVGKLKDKTFGDLATQLDTWTQGDYVFLGTTIAITLEWKAATIDLYEDKTTNPKTETAHIIDKEFVFGGNYRIKRDSVTSGKSLAYYYYGEDEEPAKSVIVCDDGNAGEIVWDYLNIPSGKFKYKNISTVENSPKYVYTLTLKRYEVDNIYKLTLNGLYGDETPSGAYGPTSGNPEKNENELTYINWMDAKYAKPEEGKVYTGTAEAYANAFGGKVKTYVSGIDGNSTEYQLRTVYSDKTGKFIFVANKHIIGNLDFNKTYCELIAWRYNGKEGNTDFLLTDDYNNKLTNSQSTAKILEDTWVYDGAGTQVLYAMFYRESYKFNFDTIIDLNDKSYGNFYGYLTVEVEDTIDNANIGSLVCGTGKYLVVYVYDANVNNGAYVKKVYKFGDGLSSDDIAKIVANLSTNIGDLTSIADTNITIYGGCEIKVKVYDQSKIADLKKDNAYYDQMLGYRFNGAFTGAADFGDKNNVSYTFNLDTLNIDRETGTTLLTYGTGENDNITLSSGQEVKLNANFAPITYKTSISMAISTGGLIEITHATGDKTTTSSTYSFNNLQRGSKYEFFYYAYAGYGLGDPDFALSITNSLIGLQSIDFGGTEITRQTPTELQTLYFQLGGAWLRQYMYGLLINDNDTTFTCSPDAVQNIQPIIINNKLLDFDVNYYVFNQDNNDASAPLGTGNVLGEEEKWQLGKTITWNLPHAAITFGNENEILTYYYLAEDGVKYAILSSWSYLPRSIADRSQYNQKYLFLLKNQPIHIFNIDTEHLFNMVQTTAGLIVPEENRTIYLAMQVVPMYEITLKIKADNANDTNCSTRTVSLTNGDNNSIVLTTTNTLEETAIGYTYLGLSNVLLASYDQDYYTSVKFIANQAEISSPFTLSGDTTIFADFTPKELSIDITYNYKGRVLDESEILDYFDTAVSVSEIRRGQLNNITNNPSVASYVLQNDTIILSYALKTGYKVRFEVNSSQDRLSADDGIEVTALDYKKQGINIRVLITDGEKGQIELKVVADNSNGAVFHEEDLQTMQSFVDLYIREGLQEKSIQFMLGYTIRIKLNKLPYSYEFVGIKKDYGQVNPDYKLDNNGYITITDGVLPEGMAEDSFIASVSGTYYAVFKKVLVNTELVLTSNNRNNYTYKSNGYQATGRNSIYTLPKQSSVNDVLTFVRQQNLLQEELDYYYYVNKDGEQKISGDTLKITEELLDTIETVNGSKTIRLYVKSKSKYYVTVTIDEKSGAQYLNEVKLDNTILTGTTRFVSGYYVENSELTLKITSKAPTKYSISVDGGEKMAEIEQTFKLTSDRNFVVVISKNQFKLTTTEELYDDIISWKLNDPTTLQDGERFNSDIAQKSYLYNDKTRVDFVATAEKTDGKKQLTAISFADEVLSFTFNMNWQADQLNSCFEVKLADGTPLTSGVTVERDKNNSNIIILSVQIDGNTYQYSLQLTPGQNGTADSIQLAFTGSDNVALKLSYTAVKVLGIS